MWRGVCEAAAVAAMVFGVYMKTMPPTITGGDSGEVMAAACSAAPAHPPGYPLFVLLAQAAMWAFRGVGENAGYRVNVMCAVMTAMGVYNLHRAGRALTGCGAAATMAAGMYGLSPLIWNNAIQAEVFSLNNLFVCLLTNVLVGYLARRDRRSNSLAYFGALISGLGLTNQHTLVFYLAVIVPTVLWSGRSTLLRPLPFLLLTAAFVAGLMPYSLTWSIRGCPIPWAEQDGAILGTKLCPAMARVPKYTWGDSRSFQGFLNHVLRRDYGTLSLAAGGASVHGKPVSLLTGLYFYLEDAAGPRLDERVRGGGTVSHDGQLLYFGVPFALWGIAECVHAFTSGGWRGRHAASKRLLISAYVLYLVVFHALANLPIRVPLFRAVHARFWQMPNRLCSPACLRGLWVIELVIGVISVFRKPAGASSHVLAKAGAPSQPSPIPGLTAAHAPPAGRLFRSCFEAVSKQPLLAKTRRKTFATGCFLRAGCFVGSDGCSAVPGKTGSRCLLFPPDRRHDPEVE